MSTPLLISYIALWILVLVQIFIVLGLVRIVAKLQQAGVATNNAQGMDSGQEAPSFTA